MQSSKTAPFIESKSVAIRIDIGDYKASGKKISLVERCVVYGLRVRQSRDPGARPCPCSAFPEKLLNPALLQIASFISGHCSVPYPEVFYSDPDPRNRILTLGIRILP
jgi:hypothetical protein